ncbi:MAG: DUF4982 domain-containing protein [Christensenellaceae bacterium]|nr:DUF4982 domain-containing protein [Christensenellaceae bacterium]
MRETIWLKDGFLFIKENGEKIAGQDPQIDTSAWENVRIPHDWAIGHDFKPDNDPKQVEQVNEDGSKTLVTQYGNTGALPTVGRGWYRKPLFFGKELEGKRIFLEFDGIMWRSEIYLNGSFAGKNHFGYMSFEVEITEFVRFGEENMLAILAEVDPDCSRWYSGAGIFRNIRLVIKEAAHIKYSGIHVKTPFVSDEKATLTAVVSTEGNADQIINTVVSPNGENLGEFAAGEMKEIASPQLWSPENPYLYSVITRVYSEGKLADEVETKIGFRYFSYDENEGFAFNGKKTVFKGVCQHHDLGILGAAVEESALRRQLQILKNMGCNAIRTSHNPPTPELLSLCDEMGFFVMDELFDEWTLPKVKNGYSKYFGEHAADDARKFIRRDRNHPSIVIWSIGNEIPEQVDKKYKYIAEFLRSIVRSEDDTRPVTMAFDRPESHENGMTDVVDIVGLNYKPHLYEPWHEWHPAYKLYGSETASCISSRGEFILPMAVEHPVMQNDDLTVNSYDLTSPAWSQHPDLEFAAQDDNPNVFGEFVWTGFDYIGEPTPYNDKWPARSSYFGIVDLCGMPKSRYYLYKSRWSGENVLHISPHWNWEGYEGKEIPVQLYTNFETAELFLNGKSLGKRSKNAADELGRYRIIWQVPYEAGEIRAVAFDKDGNAAMEAKVVTAKEPKQLKLFCDGADFYEELMKKDAVYAAKRGDILFVYAAIVDEDGNICPKAAEEVELTGCPKLQYIGSSNGDPRETLGFAVPKRKTYNGFAAYAFRISEEAGETVRVTGKMGDFETSIRIQIK